MRTSARSVIANVLKAGCGAGLMLAAAGCSWQQGYYAGQGWQMNQCQRHAETGARSRCESSAKGTYDEYRRVRQDTLR